MKSLYEDLPPVEIAGRKFVGRVLFGLLVVVSALVGATTGLLLVYTTDLPQVEALEAYRPSSITELYDDHGRVIGSFALQRRVVAGYDDFAPVLRDSLVSIEDKDFYRHSGINFWRSERLTALFLFKDRDPVVLCPAFEEARLRGMSSVDNVVTWQETEDPFAKAAGFFPSAQGTLAVEPSTAYEDVEKLLAARPGWSVIKAVASHRVYTVDPNIVSRPGPRIVDALKALEADLYPGS